MYSPHLFSWLTDLQDRRLQELMERVFQDVKQKMTTEMKQRVLQLKVWFRFSPAGPSLVFGRNPTCFRSKPHSFSVKDLLR